MTLGLTRHRPGELPAEVTRFVGRQRELAELSGLLRSARLVTVIGPGGVGKTRIAQRVAAQLASEFGDGACLVELSGLRDPELLPDTVANCLGLPGSEGRPQLDLVIDHLRDRSKLLILDTCEHLIDACAMLAEILLRTTSTTVLATSRQPLAVPGEHTCSIPPLPVPAPDALTAGQGDAVELFARCAAAAVPGFAVTDANRADVVRLCRRLDGVPLAIELATVRLRALPLVQLTERLEDRFRLLTGGRRVALPHHQTMRAATEWSYDLCSPDEQLLWERLSVFAGSFDTDGAEQVCAGPPLAGEDILFTLIGLIDKSVVLRVDDGETRYLLLDTIREFGAEKLACRSGEAGPAGGPDELAALRDRHVSRYLAMATAFGDNPTGEDQVPRYRQLVREHAELRAALEYALAAPGRDRDAAALATSLYAYWQMSSHPGEGRYWLGKVLPRLGAASRERALALVNDGYLASLAGDVTGGLERLAEGIAITDQLGDQRACARAYLYLNMALCFAGRYDEAAAAGERAYCDAEATGDAAVLITLDHQMGYLHALAGRVEQGMARCRAGLARLGPGSRERWQQSYLNTLTALCLFFQGKLDSSAEALRTGLVMKQEIGDTMGTGYALEGAAWLAAAGQRYPRAAWLLGAADSLWQQVGSRLGLNPTVEAQHTRAELATRDALGEERYRALHDAGARYPLAEVIRIAAAECDDLPPYPDRSGRQPGSGAAAVPGAVAMPGAVAASGAGAASGRDPVPADGELAPRQILTGRELEIAGLVVQGLSHREIAGRLVISKRTVDAHVEHIYGKLGVSSRVQLTAWHRSAQASE
jgi:predicted ATPase/DNA-binding CsgD family transcriptional regulator